MRSNDTGTVFNEAALTDLDEVSKRLIEKARGMKIWLMRGEMGAGKTTLIKAMGRALGVTDGMSSPTFSIVNEYVAGPNRIYHFDFYRIKNEEEAYDIGAEEYFYSGNYCFIEWPEKIASLIPAQHASVAITSENQTLRTIALSLHDGKEENRI